MPTTELVAPVCKHWELRGVCLVRDQCIFTHPEEVGAAVRARLAQLEEKRLQAARPNRHGELEVTINNRGKGKRNLVRNKTRSAAFRRFLLDTFGHEKLAAGSGVLDVAAGKGELSFQLRSAVGSR